MIPDDPGKPAAGDSFASLFEHGGTKGAKQRWVTNGDELDVVVIKVGHDAVFVDLDGKREAYIDAADLIDAKGNKVELPVGTRVRARVVQTGGGIRLKPLALRRPGEPEQDEQENVELLGPKHAIMVGAKLKATVSRIEQYGAFLQIEGTTDSTGRGLLPLVETTLPRGSDPRKHFTVGQVIEVKVVAIDEQQRVKFSTKALLGDEERERFEQFRKESGGNREPRTGFGTLGDLLAKKKK
jgi:ribosomal protein S1